MTSELTAPGMTAIDGSVLGPSIPAGEAPPQGDAAPGDGAAPGGEIAPERGRRRRMVLLFLLLAATAALLTIGGWYLLNRKPISELPVPGSTVEAVPHYSVSIYDVVAPTGVAVNADGSRIYATQTEGDPGVALGLRRVDPASVGVHGHARWGDHVVDAERVVRHRLDRDARHRELGDRFPVEQVPASDCQK